MSTAYACSRRPFESTCAAAGSSSTTRILISLILFVYRIDCSGTRQFRESPGLRFIAALAGHIHCAGVAEGDGLSLRFTQRFQIDATQFAKFAAEESGRSIKNQR